MKSPCVLSSVCCGKKVSPNCREAQQFVIGDNISFDSVWMFRCWQTKIYFKRHAKSSLFGVAFDQLGGKTKFFSNRESNFPPSKEHLSNRLA